MARDIQGSPDYMSGGPSLSSVLPFSLATWINLDGVGAYRGIIMTRSGGIVGLINTGGAGNPLGYTWENTADEYNGATGLSISTGTWYLAALVVTSTEATVYLGTPSSVSSWTNTKAHSAKSPSAWQFGRDSVSSASRTTDGRLAESAMWSNIALSAAQISSLSKGASPLLVQRAGLVGYWPLVGNTSPEIDFVAGNGLTLNDSPPAAAHPRIYMPRGRRARRFTTAAVAASSANLRTLLGVGT